MENAFHLAVWGATLTRAGRRRHARRGAPLGARRRAARARAGARGRHALSHPARVGGVRGRARSRSWPRSPWPRASAPRPRVEACSSRRACPVRSAAGLQALANKRFTGEWSANGAIAKLALRPPLHVVGGEEGIEYLHFVEYVVKRLAHHHFADAVPWGWIVPVVGLVPLFVAAHARHRAGGCSGRRSSVAPARRHERPGPLAERALHDGLPSPGSSARSPSASACSRAHDGRPLGGPRSSASRGAARRPSRSPRGQFFCARRLPNFRDQVWFFGRASRNIRDQHLVAGKTIARLKAARVLVGDAGALPSRPTCPGSTSSASAATTTTRSRAPALHGLGASIELIERMPDADRAAGRDGHLPELVGGSAAHLRAAHRACRWRAT
jgi:hypothetical protein